MFRYPHVPTETSRCTNLAPALNFLGLFTHCWSGRHVSTHSRNTNTWISAYLIVAHLFSHHSRMWFLRLRWTEYSAARFRKRTTDAAHHRMNSVFIEWKKCRFCIVNVSIMGLALASRIHIFIASPKHSRNLPRILWDIPLTRGPVIMTSRLGVV